MIHFSDKDALAVLRDQREEESGITFDTAVTRFTTKLYEKICGSWAEKHLIHVTDQTEVYTTKGKRWIEVSIWLKYIDRAHHDRVQRSRLPYTFCWIDIHSGSIRNRGGALRGHVFENEHQFLQLERNPFHFIR